jgi:hypothetical protein
MRLRMFAVFIFTLLASGALLPALAQEAPPPGTPTPPAPGAPTPTAPTPTPPTPTAPTAPTPTPPTPPTAPTPTEPTPTAPGQTQGGQTQEGQTQEGQRQGGETPILSITSATPELKVGQPNPVQISLQNIQPVDLQQQIEARMTASNATLRLSDGREGTEINLQLSVAAFQEIGRNVSVTPTAVGPVSITVSGWPAGRPQEAIFATNTFGAVEPAPETESVAPLIDSNANQVPTRTGPTTAKQIDLPVYQPLENSEDVVETTTTAVVVLVAASAATGALVAASPGSRSELPQRQEKRESASLEGVAVSFAGLAAGAGAMGFGDRLGLWRLPGTGQLDQLERKTATTLARVSPLMARLLLDSTYLRAMFGSAALVLPAVGLVLGLLAWRDVGGLALAPSLLILCAIAFLGTLDALAGAIAVATFIIGVGVSGGLTTPDSVRTMLGIGVIAFGPALIAGAFRPLRREAHEYSTWERLTDFVLVPLFGAFAVQGMVRALPGLSGYDLPIAESANVVALVVLIGLVIRILLEELAGRVFPQRIGAVALSDIPSPSFTQKAVAAGLRTALFAFIAIAFLGNVWQLWVGTAVFGVGQVLELTRDRFPNSPKVYQFMPGGLFRLVMVLLISLGSATLVSLLFSDESTRAQMAFVLLMLPGLVLTAIGSFGRKPKDGDVRWYLRPVWRTWYRIGGVLMLVAAIGLTQAL